MTGHVCVLLFLCGLVCMDATAEFDFGEGTTPNLKEIFIGKCYDYQNVINPGVFANGDKRNCSRLYEEFLAGFVRTDPCGARREDYSNYTRHALHPIPKDKSMFWEGVYDFVYQYTNLGRRYTGISDTLTGYPPNGLHWCSASQLTANIPTCPECAHSSEIEFWRQTSIAFAQGASGVAHVMLNGTRTEAFTNTSVFAQYELTNLDPQRVSLLNVLLIHDIGRPVSESCGMGSLKVLESITVARGLKYKCTDDPTDIRFLQCVDQPQAPECETSNPSGGGRKVKTSSLLSVLATTLSTMRRI